MRFFLELDERVGDVQLALERGGEDNVTVVVAELSGEGLTRSSMPESVTQTFQVLQEFEPNLGVPRSAGQQKAPPEAAAPVAPVGAPVADSARAEFAHVASAAPASSGVPKRLMVAIVVVVLVLLSAAYAACGLFCSAPQ